MVVAASAGQCELFSYLVAKGYLFNKSAIVAATEFGRLDNLILAHSHIGSLTGIYSHRTAQYGHLECLKFLHTHGCMVDRQTCSAAAGNGHLPEVRAHKRLLLGQ